MPEHLLCTPERHVDEGCTSSRYSAALPLYTLNRVFHSLTLPSKSSVHKIAPNFPSFFFS